MYIFKGYVWTFKCQDFRSCCHTIVIHLCTLFTYRNIAIYLIMFNIDLSFIFFPFPLSNRQSWSFFINTNSYVYSSDLIPVISNNFVNPDTIFANNEMSLQDTEIYGFDYDYTLAFYSSHLHTLIFNIARDILIQEHRVSEIIFVSFQKCDKPCKWTASILFSYQYPEGLREYEYIPNFVIRGLHYDVQKVPFYYCLCQVLWNISSLIIWIPGLVDEDRCLSLYPTGYSIQVVCIL